MNSSQIVGDIDMETIDPKKSNVMVECNREREDIGSSKRFKGIEEINEKKATYAEVIHVDEVDKDNCNWDTLWGIANTLLFDIVEENENAAKECNDEDVHDVDVDAKVVLQSFDVFYDRAVILFFTGKLPYINWIKQWLNTIVSPNCVENIYAGPRGFYDVVFRSPEHRSALLAKVPVFFDKRLVHVMQWSPVVDYHALLKQECPVWVTVDCKHAFLWPLLPELMSQMGKVLVSPHANATNKCRFCVLWDTSRKRPGWVRMNTPGMKRLCFKLKWETFAGHCFGCGEWGHFMAECHRHCPSTIEVPNEGNGKEGVGRDVGVSDIVVVMDEGTSSRAGYKEVSLQGLGPKNKGTQSMDMEKQNLVVIDKGKKPLDRTSNDVVVEKDWHQVKGKSKGKSMNMQRNSLPTTRETTWKSNSGTREGPRKVPWQRQFRDKGLPLHLQFDSLGRVVNSSNSRGFRQAGEPKQKSSIDNSKDVVHENPYAALEHALTSFMTSVALKEQVHP